MGNYVNSPPSHGEREGVEKILKSGGAEIIESVHKDGFDAYMLKSGLRVL